MSFRRKQGQQSLKSCLRFFACCPRMRRVVNVASCPRFSSINGNWRVSDGATADINCLTDVFRNIFLSLQSSLSSLPPPQKKTSRYNTWKRSTARHLTHSRAQISQFHLLPDCLTCHFQTGPSGWWAPLCGACR